MKIFYPNIIQPTVTVYTSTYTIDTSRVQSALLFNSGSGVQTVTIPSSSVSASATMDYIDCFQLGAAQVQFTTGSTTISLLSSNGFTTRTTGSVATLINVGQDQWLLTGDTT